MAPALDYFIILFLISALGAFLFLASTLIFLAEEAAKFLLRSIRAFAIHFHRWSLDQDKALLRAWAAVHIGKD